MRKYGLIIIVSLLALSSLADELNATNIIIGRKGQSPLKTKLFGSVASTLVQISAHPVTVVP